MAVAKKSLDNLGKGKKFSSDNQPEKRGRRRSVLTTIREGGMSVTDIKKVIRNLIWEYDSKELAELLKNKELMIPMGMTLILGALVDDQKKNSIANFEKLMDRSDGKPTQNSVVEFTDISDNAKDRLSQIFASAKKKTVETKPKKTASRAATGKKRKDEAGG